MEKVRLTRGKVCYPNKQKSDRNTLESIPDWILNTHVRANSYLHSVLSWAVVHCNVCCDTRHRLQVIQISLFITWIICAFNVRFFESVTLLSSVTVQQFPWIYRFEASQLAYAWTMGALMLKNACVVAFPGMHKLQANCQLACVNLTEMLVMCSTVPSCLKRVGLKVDQLFVLRKKKKSSRLHYFSVLVYFLAYILCIEKGALTHSYQLQGDCFLQFCCMFYFFTI